MVYFFQTLGIGYLDYFLGSTYFTRKMTVDLLTVKVVSESRVTWTTSANFSLPRPLCTRLRPDVRDRQTSDAHHCSMPPPYAGGA